MFFFSKLGLFFKKAGVKKPKPLFADFCLRRLIGETGGMKGDRLNSYQNLGAGFIFFHFKNYYFWGQGKFLLSSTLFKKFRGGGKNKFEIFLGRGKTKKGAVVFKKGRSGFFKAILKGPFCQKKSLFCQFGGGGAGKAR